MITIQKIYKYELKPNGSQNIVIPKGSEILTIQSQYGKACMWCLCPIVEDGDYDCRNIEIYATGEPIASDMGVTRDYLGTFQLENGRLVFHVFEYTGV